MTGAWQVPTIVLVTVVCFASAPAVFWMRAHWRWSDLDETAVRRVLLVGAITGIPYAIISCLVASLCAGLLPGYPWLMIAAPLAITAALILWQLRISAPLSRIHHLVAKLDDPTQRDQARDDLLAYLAQYKPDDEAHATFHAAAATGLSNAGLHTDSVRILEAIPVAVLQGHSAELCAIGIVAGRAVLGDTEGARAAQPRVPKLVPGSIHGLSMENIEARLLVLEGHAERARQLVATDLKDPALQRGRLRVRAHALAALEQAAAARDCLRQLRDAHGRPALEAVTREVGPANQLAQAMLLEDIGPYR